MKLGRAFAAALVTAAFGLGATCDNLDLSRRFVLRLAPGDGEVIDGFAQPYIGRMGIDFGLRNTGTAAAAYTISAQAQTAGDEDAQACEFGLRTSPRVMVAAESDGSGTPAEGQIVPILRTEERTHFVTLPRGSDEGLVDLRIRRSGASNLYVSGESETISLLTTDGEPITPSEVRDTDSCDLFSTVASFDLADGTYRVVVREDGTTILLQQACESVRTVPRTCPGTVSDIHVREPIELEAGQSVSGRIDSDAVGVGNRAVVSVACTDGGSGCAAEMELFIVTTQLDCRRDTDCPNVAACTEDGYCRRVRDRGCASSAAAPAAVLLALVPVLVAVRRRR